MAYSETKSPTNYDLAWTLIDGKRYWTVLITQVEVDPAAAATHEWEIEVPSYATILEQRVVVTDDAGGTVTSITPQLGLAEGWTEDDEDHLLTLTPSPAGLAAISYEQPTFACPNNVLRGRAVPDAAGGTIVTRITLREG